MFFWCWLLVASSVISEVAGLPISKLQQRSLDEAVVPTSKQQGNVLRRVFTKRVTLRILEQASSTTYDDAINHAQNALEYLNITSPKLDSRSLSENSASQELATGSPWWSRTLQIAASLKRQTTCGDHSQCGDGNNNNGSSNGVNNSDGDGGGSSTTDRNIALGVGLGVGIPSAIAAIATIYECMTGHSSPIPGIVTIYLLIRKGRKNKSQSPYSGPQQNGGAQC